MRAMACLAIAALLVGCGTGVQTQGGSTASGQGSPDAASSSTVVSPSGSASAEGRTGLPLVVVLDASGSMKADDAAEGVTRMAAAQQAVGAMFAATPAGTEAAFVGYGTKMQGSETAEQGCGDVEVLSPMAPVDAAGLKAKVDSVAAGGWTPIGPALKEAASQLGGRPGRIVLVTDGKNTCQSVPPCDVAKDLKASNPGLSISVLGLRTDQEEMGCVAQATGGFYTTADTAKQLLSRGVAALDEATAAASLTPSGVAGIQVGATWDDIAAAHPDFPSLEGSARQEWNGETAFVVVWLNCQWLFSDGKLVAIGVGADAAGRTLDGFGPSDALSAAEAFLGQPIATSTEGADKLRVYPANQMGMYWRVLTDEADVIKFIYICRCRPTENAGELVLSFEGLGPYHLGATDLVEKGAMVYTNVCQDGGDYWSSPELRNEGIQLLQEYDAQRNPTDPVAEIIAMEPLEGYQSPVVTYGGVKIGDTVEKALKAHPDMRTESKETEAGPQTTGVVRSGDLEMVFEDNNRDDPGFNPKDQIQYITLRAWSPSLIPGGC